MTISIAPSSAHHSPHPSGGSNVPQRIRILTAVIAGLAILLGWLIVQGVTDLRGGFDEIGGRDGPQVAATADLNLALNDMDAQVADLLLIGADEKLGTGHDTAMAGYERSRRQADADLQQAVAATAGDARAQQALRAVLDTLGSYEANTARAIQLNDQAKHRAGEPPAEALAQYRSANAELRTRLLPAVAKLTEAESAALDHAYQANIGHRARAVALTILASLALLTALITLQVLLAGRFHRHLNPPLLLATLAVAALLITSMSMFSTAGERLRVAKEDAFDSVLAMSRARATSHDANADHSRFLLDPAYRDQAERDFYDKAQQIAWLPGMPLPYYPTALRQSLAVYRTDRTNVAWYGYFGTEFHNITFPGEQRLAEQALSQFVSYLDDDATMREQVRNGNLLSAVRFGTSDAAGDVSDHFEQYDRSLAQLIGLNRSYFDRSVQAGRHGLGGWTLLPWLAAAAVVGLSVSGVRPRLAEYR